MENVSAVQNMLTVQWHSKAATWAVPKDTLHALVSLQHAANFELWHLEDEARATSDLNRVGAVKHKIDEVNQRRNDLMERIDDHFYALPAEEVMPLRSETPGMMIDRLSILSLKIYHMEEQTRRTDVSAEHRSKCEERVRTLRKQRDDLETCLEAVLLELENGVRHFRLYRQMKMYNDPTYRKNEDKENA